jgi:hypothetical protein
MGKALQNCSSTFCTILSPPLLYLDVRKRSYFKKATDEMYLKKIFKKIFLI